VLDVNKSIEVRIASRMLEFFYRDVPWNRALWSPGLRVQLLEILESSEAVQAGALHVAALQHFCGQVLPLAVNDQGVGDSRAKAVLNSAMNGKLLYRSADYYSMEMLARDLGQSYLARWSQHLRDTPTPSVERAARSIAAHLFDLGFDSDFLHQWWTYRISYEAGTKSLADLVEEAHALSQEQPKQWDALVAFEALPTRGGVPEGWLDSTAVHAWLDINGFSVEGVRQNGGVELSVTARDPYAAVSVIREKLDAISARIALGLTGRLRPFHRIWIRNQPKPFDLFRIRHRAEIHSLRKERQLYSIAEESSLLDSAIALLQPVNGGNLSAAISGAWAAIEALLYSPGDGDRVTAGDRLATIVACSFPRAELTALAHNLDGTSPLGAKVASINENKAKAREVAIAIQNNEPIQPSRPIDEASLERIRKIATSGAIGLRDIQGHLSCAFRRLYRSRNLILHWGRVGGDIRRACLRTTAPLVGAGMDRIAHSWLIEGLHPLGLASRATASLASIKPGGANLVDLLE
jgi:hypothetical protein